MRVLICSVIILLQISGLKAQSAEDSVKSAINLLFNAMKQSDSLLLTSAFTDSAILQTIEKNKQGNIRIKTDKVIDFARSIKSAPVNALDEQIKFDIIKTDGNLAIAWTPYKFYYNGKYSHCGVNSFQLVRINNIWKIQYLIDTRRTSNCP